MSHWYPRLLVLIRHAESLRNSIKRNSTKKGATALFADDEDRRAVRGTPDHEIPLTDAGREQACRTGPFLRSKYGRPDYVYHSGYRRTIETAEGILSTYSEEERQLIQVRHNMFLRERDPGYTYDMTEDEARRHFPWLQEYWNTFGGFMGRPPGGESLADVANRVHDFLNMIFRDRADMSVFVVTHGGTIRAFRMLLEKQTYEQALKSSPKQSSNCGVTTYEFDAGLGRLTLKENNTIYWK